MINIYNASTTAQVQAYLAFLKARVMPGVIIADMWEHNSTVQVLLYNPEGSGCTPSWYYNVKIALLLRNEDPHTAVQAYPVGPEIDQLIITGEKGHAFALARRVARLTWLTVVPERSN